MSTSLTKAIHFRKLVTQLTHQERVQFLSKLLDSHIDIIMAGLFQHFSKPSQIDQVTDFNKSLLDIIQSRTEKPKQLCTNHIQLHQFPRAIVGYTASFLGQNDYIQFSLSNRSVYLGCNLPNTLQRLDLYQQTYLHHNIISITYPRINLASFPSIKCLQIDPMKAIEAGNMSFDLPNFNQVTILRLAAPEQRGWVQSFLNLNIVNCENVTELQCREFGSRRSSMELMEGKEFLSLLQAFPNLTHLHMLGIHITEDITAQDIADLCPGIVSLRSYGIMNDLIMHLVKIFARQLKYLNLEQPSQNQFAFDDTQFDQLEEFCFLGPDNKSCNGVVKSALNIKKICVMYWKDWMSDDEIKDDIVNTMRKCRSLNHLCFLCKHRRHSRSILDGIESGLFEIKMLQKPPQRKNLKIYISFEATGKHDPRFHAIDFTMNFGRIIYSLEASNIPDFMLVLNLPGIDDDAVNEISHNVCKLLTNTNVTTVHKKLIVTNKNCKINGYQDLVCGCLIDNDGWFFRR
eukprot:124967_1